MTVSLKKRSAPFVSHAIIIKFNAREALLVSAPEGTSPISYSPIFSKADVIMSDRVIVKFLEPDVAMQSP